MQPFHRLTVQCSSSPTIEAIFIRLFKAAQTHHFDCRSHLCLTVHLQPLPWVDGINISFQEHSGAFTGMWFRLLSQICQKKKKKATSALGQAERQNNQWQLNISSYSVVLKIKYKTWLLSHGSKILYNLMFLSCCESPGNPVIVIHRQCCVRGWNWWEMYMENVITSQLHAQKKRLAGVTTNKDKV